MTRLRFAFALMGVFACATGLRAESLEKAMRGIAAGLVTDLSAQGHTSVGVLKWLIQKDDKTSASFGPLNQGLANRLETALLQAQFGLDEPKLRVVRKASAVAEKLPRTTHLKADQRHNFFEQNGQPVAYDLYLGGKTTPDVMLTGLAIFDENFEFLKIRVWSFTRERPTRQAPFGEWVTVDVDLNVLADAGESFSLRGSGDPDSDQINFDFGDSTPSTKPVEPTPQALSAAIQQADPALTTRPVVLDVLYDGAKQEPFRHPVGDDEKQLFVREPREGQTVTFRLTRVDDATPERYGVVLRVNGLNTIERQTLPVEDCRRWVFEQGAPPTLVEGFYIPEREEVLSFRVASEEESIQNAVNYGDEAGQITFTIFRDGAGQGKEPESFEELDDLEADLVTRGVVPLGATSNLELRSALDPIKTRGLIEFSKNARTGKVRVVAPFQNPGLVDTVTLIYRPRDAN